MPHMKGTDDDTALDLEVLIEAEEIKGDLTRLMATRSFAARKAREMNRFVSVEPAVDKDGLRKIKM